MAAAGQERRFQFFNFQNDVTESEWKSCIIRAIALGNWIPFYLNLPDDFGKRFYKPNHLTVN